MPTTNFDKLDVDELDVAGVDVTAAVAEMATLNGLTATAAEINKVADVSAHSATYTATGTTLIPAEVYNIELSHTNAAIVKTIDLTARRGLVTVVDKSASGTAAHTVTATAGTWDGTNDVITLDAPKEAIFVWIDSAGNGTVVANVGSITVN